MRATQVTAIYLRSRRPANRNIASDSVTDPSQVRQAIAVSRGSVGASADLGMEKPLVAVGGVVA